MLSPIKYYVLSIKQDNKIVSIGTLWLRWQFYFQYHMIVRIFLLIYNSSVGVCTDRARICFKCYVKEKRKCSFENALVEKSESATDLK